MQVGQTFATRLATPSDPFEVGREAIRAFAVAVGADDAVHHDLAAARAAGHPDLVAPPTFVVSLTMPSETRAAAEAFGDIDMADVLHRHQSFTFARPVRAGDRLVVTSRVAGRELDGRRVLTLETEVHTADGEHVCSTGSVIVHNGPVPQ